jgi:hypothetical protein
MSENRRSSPITNFNSSTRSDTDESSFAEWWAPENQLGLEPDHPFNFGRDNQVIEEVALEKKGKIKYHEGAAKY